MKHYANYHKHDHLSNIVVPDTPFKCEDYLRRIKELGYNAYWTTNHGTGGDIFEARKLCDEYEVKCFFGVEAYIVEKQADTSASSYHIVILPKTNEARKDLNEIISKANEQGFYYKARIEVTDLLSLSPDNYYITTACVAGLFKDDNSIYGILLPLANHFGRNFMLEVQTHNTDEQKRVNGLCKEFADKYGLLMVAGVDSHYIYPEQTADRTEYIRGKGVKYSSEDDFILDYPDYDTLFERFREQGVLTDKEIETAIQNTLLFERCEEIELDKEIKMPTIFPELNADEKDELLKKHISANFKTICAEENLHGERLEDYKNGIRYEMSIIEDTKELNTADYFLLNERIVDIGVNKYNGVLTRSGRGSSGAFYINRVLGLTQIDRFNSPIKLYPERFMSTARLLENRSLPDIDFNVARQEPFISAAKELLGDNGVFPMVSYGTMKLSEAFRNICRAKNIPYADYNEIAKDIEGNAENETWKPIIDEAKKYLNTIISISPHPCAFALSNKNLRREYGVVRVNNTLCVMITSEEADFWKLLKDDFLIVSTWGIIADTFALINKPIISIKELFERVDDRVWALFENGITCTLNQVDSDYATDLIKQYKPKNIRELSMFMAAVRPSFDSYRQGFLHRQPYTSGSAKLDEVLHETEGRIVFQETLMTYFAWLGITPSMSIDLIKKISKKKIKPKDFAKLEKQLKQKWIENTGSIDYFAETWENIQACMNYGFPAPHAYATAIDCLYGAYLKINYPLEYYTVAFEYCEKDQKSTAKLLKELKYFGLHIGEIKFGKSRGNYTFDRTTKTIYKSVSSVKHLNKVVAEELYALKDVKFDNFIQVLYALQTTSLNSKQLNILTKLNFFGDYGRPNALLYATEVFNKYGSCKTLKKENIDDLDLVRECCGKETEKMFSEIDNEKLVLSILHNAAVPKTNRLEYIKYQIEFLGYSTYYFPDEDIKTNVVQEIEKTSYGKLKVTLYNVTYGATKTFYANADFYNTKPIQVGDVLTCVFHNSFLKCWKKIF